MGDVLPLLGMLLSVVVILYLAYWVTRRVAMGSGAGTGAAGNNIRVYDRLALGQNKSLVIVRVGVRWLVLGVADEQITLVTELSEEESRIWRQPRPGGEKAVPPRFADILSDALRGKKHDKQQGGDE